MKQDLIKPKQQQQKLDFCFKSVKSSGNDVLDMKEVSLCFDDKPVLKDVSLNITKGERVFLYGANGSGKSTIFKVITDIYNQYSGEMKIGENVNIGYYDQTGQTLDFKKTIFDDVYDTFPKLTQTEIRNALAVFLFKGDDVFLNISSISGGERSKVALLKVMLSGANLLLLDEPTNHLDISSKEALENALINYEGTLFIISHDRYFINKLSDKILFLKDGTITEYLGNYDDFCEKRKQQKDLTKSTEKRDNQKESAKIYKEKKQQDSYIKNLQTKIKKSEQEIENIENQIIETQNLLDSKENYSDYEKTTELFSKLTTLKDMQAQSFEKWEELLKEFDELNVT